MLKKFLISDKFFVLADQVVVSAAAFATNLLLAKALGLQQFGIFSLVGLIQFFCLSISMGITTQVYQVVYPTKSIEEQKKYTTNLFYILLVCLIGFLALGILFFATTQFYFYEYKATILVSIFSTLLFLLQDFIRKVLLTQLLFKKAFIIDVITNIAQLGILLILWIMNLLTLNIAIVIVGATFIPSIILGLFWIKPTKLVKRDLLQIWREQKTKTGWLLMSNLLQWGTGYFFVIAASWWVGAAALGALRLAQYIFGLLNVVLQAFENYVLPKASASSSNNPSAYLKVIARKMLLFMLPILVTLAIFGKQILVLAGGKECEPFAYVMYGMSAIYLLITIGYPVRIGIRSQQLNQQYFKGYILSMIFSVTTVYWLLHNFQLIGVLAGLFIIQCITIGYWMMVLQKRQILSWKSYILF